MFGVGYGSGNVRSNGAWKVDDFIKRENRVYMVAVPKDYINTPDYTHISWEECDPRILSWSKTKK